MGLDSTEPLPDLLPLWQTAWRVGIAPQLSTAGLQALRTALLDDDAQLLQGATTSPPPLRCVQDWPCEAACPIGLAGWLGDGLQSVAEVEDAFANVCFNADLALEEPAACRWFINHWDETPRDEARRLLLAEVNRTLAERRAA